MQQPASHRPVSSSEEELVGQTLAGRYEVASLLGVGGMGAVYKAQHVHMRKDVAIKVLHREMCSVSEVVARFEREAIAASRVEHPAIARSLDFGRLEADGPFYMALEYIEGRNLEERLQEEGALPQWEVVRLMRLVVDGLVAAHAAGIIHRDLKPENIMLVRGDDGQEVPKILDFGIAKLSAQDLKDQPALTQLGTVFGTPQYMSPEQAAGKAVDHRADLYTVGVIFYELLTGTNPFASDDMVVSLTKQLTEVPAPLPAGFSPELSALVAQLLAKEPSQRVQTAAELGQHLDALLTQGRVSLMAVTPVTPSARVGAESVDAPTVLGAPSTEAPALQPTPSPPLSQAVTQTPHTATVSTAGPASLAQVSDGLQRKVRLGGVDAPLWGIVAAGGSVLGVLLLGLVLLLVAVSGGDPSEEPQQTASAPPAELALQQQAKSGDPKALSELAALPTQTVTPERLLAQAEGEAKRGELSKAATIYASALKLDTNVSKNKTLRKNVRRALESPKSFDEGKAAALRLGSYGADLIHHVFDDTAKDKKRIKTHKLAAAALASKEVYDLASPALRVVLDFNKAKSCGQHAKVLPDAAKHADKRALRKLRALSVRKGCGFLRLGDCWPCLRRGKDLSVALKQASETPAPEID